MVEIKYVKDGIVLNETQMLNVVTEYGILRLMEYIEEQEPIPLNILRRVSEIAYQYKTDDGYPENEAIAKAFLDVGYIDGTRRVLGYDC